MKTFFIIVISVYLLINAYVFLRGWQALPAGTVYRLIFSVSFVVLAFSFLLAMGGRNTLPLVPLKIIYTIGTTWLACMMYFLLLFLLTDIIGLFNHWFHFLPDNITAHFRQIQVCGAALVILILLVSGFYKFTHPAINTYEIKIDKKAGDRKELRVVELSDIHLGMTIDKKKLREYVDEINALKPDIILVAGDVIDSSTRPLNEERMEEEINMLEAPLGIYMCLGNHEYISGIDSSLDFLKKTKIHLLVDSVVRVDNSFSIIGRNDKSQSNRKPLEYLVAQTDKSEPIFLLDHQPYHLEDAEKNGVDFQLSGHTHNGQLWPGNYIVKYLYEVGSGYKRKGNLHVYVSSGLALWGPVFRIGTESEIAVFNIKFNE